MQNEFCDQVGFVKRFGGGRYPGIPRVKE
jgi:hypothetical protein